MNYINNFIRLRNIPFTLQEKIHRYYNYLWSRNKGMDESIVLRDLPSSLKTEVALFIHHESLSKIPFFQGAEKSFINSVVKLFKHVIYAPDDYIINAGEIGK